MPKFSIITANYNGYHLMTNYFKSLESQTFKDFEVIIIDDCSSDNSFNLLNEYAISSKINIRVLKSDVNKGPGNARNIGIKNATGLYITFIDNDDWIKKTCLEEINKIIDEQGVNCVIYDYFIKTDNSETISNSMYYGENGIISLSDSLISTRNHTFGKFYKLSECKNIFFPDTLRRCEDVAYVCRSIDACKTVYYYKYPLYYYYQRTTSLSNNKKLDQSDMVKAFAILEKELSPKYSIEISEKSVTDLFYGGLLMMCKSGKSNKEIKKYIDDYLAKYPEWNKSRILQNIGKNKVIFLQFAAKRMVFPIKVLAFIHSLLVH